MQSTQDILSKVAAGDLSPADALRMLGEKEVDLGFARVDVERARRRGLPEVIYCPGKTADQIVEIMTAMREVGQNVLATRATHRSSSPPSGSRFPSASTTPTPAP